VSVTAPAPAANRLAGAFAASLCLHGFLLASLQAVPRGGPSGQLFGGPQAAKSISVQFEAPPARAVVLDPGAAAERPAPRQTPPAGSPQSVSAIPAAGLLPPVKYYTALELDRRPQPLDHIEPVYPALALSPVGRVTLALYIGENGEVDWLEVEAADQTGDFASSARKAFASARFLPGVRNGVAVKSLMRIEVRFGEPRELTPGGQESVAREKFVPTVRVRPRK
jgi:TonB family protein